MPDKIRIQVIFKKYWWLCPGCGQEDIVDANSDGTPNIHTHTCSKCKSVFNQSGPNRREYNGCATYSPEEYEKLKVDDLAKSKSDMCDKWITSVKNPPPYVEPTKEDLEKQLADKQGEVEQLQQQIAEKEAK
jgi:transcription elongation factor Elf1